MTRGDIDTVSVVVGRNPVREALEAGDRSIEKLYLQRDLEGRTFAQLRGLARSAGVPVQVVPPGRLTALAGGATHQGVVALLSPLSYLDLDEMLSAIAPTHDDVRSRKPLLLILDEIQDPHNYGAILRSGVGAGCAGVVVPERNMAPLSATAIKASAGTALRIPIARAGNLVQSIRQMKERGYWVVGAAGEGEQTVWTTDWDRPLAIVIGNEGSGMRKGVRESCDELVSIPLYGPVESLNASVAAGVILFTAASRRASEQTSSGPTNS